MARLLPIVLPLGACASRSHDAAEPSVDGGGRPSADGSVGSGELTRPPAYCAAPDQEPAVTWEGWIEAFSFPSGSERVRVLIEPAGSGGWSGFFLAGDGPEVLATPRAPDDCNFLCDARIDESFFGRQALEGFRYSLYDVVHTDIRLRFDVDRNEVFGAWCAAQTPILDENRPEEDLYRCLRNTPAEQNFATDSCRLLPDGEPPIPVPCCKMTLCDFVCRCTVGGCFADASRVTFDLFIDGDVASGTTPFGTGHLQRL